MANYELKIAGRDALGETLEMGISEARIVAKRFRVPSKGGLKLRLGADSIVVIRGSVPVEDDLSLTRHSHSPYRQMTASLRIRSTFLRDEAIEAAGRGRFLQPRLP